MPAWLRKVLGPAGGRVALLVLAGACAYLGLYRHMRFFLVPSASMEPTLQIGDQLVTLNHSTYQRGDIVVLEDPEDPAGYIVKRIIATQGDTVDIAGGAVVVNGEYLSEPYTASPGAYDYGPYAVPEGCVFLLGDNRNNSEDSHTWTRPAVSAETIVGKVRFIYYPYARWGRVVAGPSLATPIPVSN